MLLRGITIAAVAAAVACASASPRPVKAPDHGSLVVGVTNDLEDGPDVHTVHLSLEGEPLALLESSGSGEDRTPALEVDETRVFTQDVPGGGQVCLEVTAHIGQQQVTQTLELEVPPRPVALLVTLLIEDDLPAIRIEKVPLSSLQATEKCIEPELEVQAPEC